MSDLSRVIALLSDPVVEHRLAAATVLGALEVKDPKAIAGLDKLLDGSSGERRAALDAFARLGAHALKKVLPRVFAQLTSTEPHVREAAARALKTVGAASAEAAEEMVEAIKARRALASEHEKRE